MTTEFSRARFIMVQPSHPGNVGSAARAIKTMGFAELVLVDPRLPDMTHQPEAVALASGAADVLENARTCATLEEALAPVTLAFALTARVRDLGPPPCDIRQAATLSREHLDQKPDGCVAIVLGTERSGLTNEQIGLCQRICHIPANPEYSSLNVAQALQLAAWELRYALLEAAGATLLPPSKAHQPDPGAQPASSEAVQAMLAHWEQALVAVEFLNPAHPKKLMPRMRHLFTRAELSRDEIDMMRGVCTAMLDIAGRAGPRQRKNNN
ncbi:RNA methyltransferase [Bordetella avium]|uniref:RNA methyltransferase n=1 Tax=Bordetella avium TaxID=521 RepID=UPI000E0C71C0|nr:RNA methyltransferase [Bordetella avium]RIQ13118.1 TrmJ/YjtD family RNA methyltransferase [Bordetella avium]RIQ37683.1 TrmJ/YjtD family RNA methyltransferase [Bordetella avium]RIQ42192.1 TrmJ/YjtD family RNA methyltransferase [Bordetella avium]RIQ42638.1 TrmJ/YjtD family RNA methyltransferase [Bordetella avium]RIQ49101.1 TrmJ/YjtD family RNA methyltransferase [Bordetella avium]